MGQAVTSSAWHMSIEERRRSRDMILESTPRHAVSGHQGYEPTDPPPPKHRSIPARAAKATGDAIRGHVSLIKDVLMLLGVLVAALGAGFDWFRSRVSASDLDAVRKQCAADVASATAPIATLAGRVRTVERRQGRDDQRWDKFDSYNAKQKRPSTTTMAPPKFGPAAERRGEVRYDELEDE